MDERLNIIYLDLSGKEYFPEDSVKKGDNYTFDDCVLVRTTDIFPFNGVVRIPKEDGGYEFGPSGMIGDAIRRTIRHKYTNLGIDEKQTRLYEEELRSYYVVFETCRSTIHFCMNGIVTSHSLGSFDNQPYTIIEPFKYHVDDSLKCLRVEDTYFDRELVLSDDAVILINAEHFEKIKGNIEMFESLKSKRIVVYKGNKALAIESVLKDLGYDSFVINNHGYQNGISAGKSAFNMTSFIYNFAEKNGISLDRHFSSQINARDTEERLKKGEIIDREHLFYIINNSNLPSEFALKVEECLNYRMSDKLDELMDELVRVVGLERIKQLTHDFNKQYIAKLNSTKSRVL